MAVAVVGMIWVELEEEGGDACCSGDASKLSALYGTAVYPTLSKTVGRGGSCLGGVPEEGSGDLRAPEAPPPALQPEHGTGSPCVPWHRAHTWAPREHSAPGLARGQPPGRLYPKQIRRPSGV